MNAATTQNQQPPAPDREQIKRLTFRLELKRAVSGGVLEAATHTFLLLFAVQVFQSGATVKALLVSGAPIGFLVSPLAVSIARALRWSPGRGAAVLAWIGGCGFLVAASSGQMAVFLSGSLAGLICMGASVPLLTQIYQDNYPAEERGDLFSIAMIVKVAVMIVFAAGAGVMLDRSLDTYRLLLLVFGLALALAGFWAAKFPSQPLDARVSCHPLHALRHLRDDREFLWLQISWMLLGAGTLMMAPLRIEYLGNPEYGVEMSPAAIALLVSVVPSVVQLFFARLWGRLFDRINFFLLRIILNLFFVLWLISFFLLGGLVGFALGGLFYGFGVAGGNIAWSLWATKLAKPELVADYMGVHTFLTGIRAITLPFLGFYLSAFVPMGVLAGAGILVILVGSAMLVPEARTLKRRRPGSPLTPGPAGVQE